MRLLSLKRRRRVVAEDGPDPIDVFVGGRVRERRLQTGLTQPALGNQLGVSYQVVQRYETGLIRISASTLYRLARVLNVEPNDFFSGYAGPIALRARKENLRR